MRAVSSIGQIALGILILAFPMGTIAEEVCEVVRDAKIVAQDSNNTYLGKISNKMQSESIFNDFGKYGNEFSSESIWNEFSTFGNEFNAESPFNQFSFTPPMIIKNGKVIGYLSANKSIKSSITPKLLKALCEDEL